MKTATRKKNKNAKDATRRTKSGRKSKAPRRSDDPRPAQPASMPLSVFQSLGPGDTVKYWYVPPASSMVQKARWEEAEVVDVVGRTITLYWKSDHKASAVSSPAGLVLLRKALQRTFNVFCCRLGCRCTHRQSNSDSFQIIQKAIIKCIFR